VDPQQQTCPVLQSDGSSHVKSCPKYGGPASAQSFFVKHAYTKFSGGVPLSANVKQQPIVGLLVEHSRFGPQNTVVLS